MLPEKQPWTPPDQAWETCGCAARSSPREEVHQICCAHTRSPSHPLLNLALAMPLALPWIWAIVCIASGPVLHGLMKG